MSRVFFMCGPSGSGKTTYAAALEAGGAVRLSFDEEMWRRGVTTLPAPTALLREIEVELRARLEGLVAAGRDVVLDFPFSTRAVRDEYRALLAPLGIVPEVVYLATDRETVLARLRRRGDRHADDLVLDEDAARIHFDGFEAPTADEGPLRVIG